MVSLWNPTKDNSAEKSSWLYVLFLQYRHAELYSLLAPFYSLKNSVIKVLVGVPLFEAEKFPP